MSSIITPTDSSSPPIETGGLSIPETVGDSAPLPPGETVLPAIDPHAGGLRELAKLAWPLILSSSFLTIQFFLDAVFLTWYDTRATGAVMLSAVLFWTCFVLLQTTANYATTFVAQYIGAGRKERVGPAVWQSIYFALFTGIAFMGLWFLADDVMSYIGHAPEVQAMELTYFRCLCFCALPMLITAACNSFFAGRGESRIVLLVDLCGTIVNVILGYCLIFGALGLPRWGVAGAGWALVCGSWVAASVAFGMMMRRRYRADFATLSGWRFDPPLFKRMMRFGLPAGMQWMFDGLAFTVFIAVVGMFGATQLTASSIAHRINMLAFLPMIGIGQAVAVLVGQRLGQNRPDLAERSAKVGLKVAAGYMTIVALLYVLLPSMFLAPFQNGEVTDAWRETAAVVTVLLWFVAIYSLFNSIEVVYTFALRGAGDTVFVTWVSILLAWPMMVFPTWLSYRFGWGLYWAWGFASAYIIAIAMVFMFRFRGGKWKSMRVIEHAPVVVP
jgi:MATE family multidrug resistance protein